MLRSQKIIVGIFLTCLCLCRELCAAQRIRKGNFSREDDSETGNHHHNKHHDTDLPHRLETAPIPAVHSGPQPLKLETRSAPIALENRYDPFSKQLERVNRHISFSNSPNPQKPTGWNGYMPRENRTSNEDSLTSRFYHPGHTQLSNISPTNNNNYYSILKAYGGAFPYGPNQPFKGYRETENIGVIPPRYVDARNYYNSISGLRDRPFTAQQSDTLQSLYARQQSLPYGYGYETRDSVKKSYKNVITGLLMWSFMNGISNGRRYTIYNHKSLPNDFQNQIVLTNNTLAKCSQDALILCQNYAEPICTNNGTKYCVTSTVVPCQNEKFGNICANTTIPCNNCQDNKVSYLPCLANLTVVAGSGRDDSNAKVKEVKDSDYLCVTTLLVPKDKNQDSCNDSVCSVNDGESNSESITEKANESKIQEKTY